MKVLKPGREQKGFSVEQTCTGKGNGGGGCGALLLVERGDMRYYRGGGYLDRDPEVVFRCVCGVTTDMSRDSWPPNASGTLKAWSPEWRDHGRDRDTDPR